MRFHDVFDDAQPDAHALRLAAQFRAKPVETLENLLVFGCGNAGAAMFGAVASNVTPKRAMLRCWQDGECFTSLRATSSQDWP